jgi:hypothetical protein
MADQFIVERTFLDITETGGLQPGETKLYSANSPQQTPNTITSSTTTGANAYEVVQMEVVPPRNSQGQFEDLREIWLVVDGGSTIQHYINVPGFGWTLMTPLVNQVWGGPRFAVPFGLPFWQTIRQKGANPNHPILNTTIKFAKSIQVAVRSVYGVTGAYRIILKGYQYSAALLANLAPQWQDTVYVQTPRRAVTGKPALSFTFARPGPISLETWTALPGGQNQGAIKINPYWRFAFNANATQAQNPYTFSIHGEVAGAPGNVENTYQDLALVFAENTNAFILRGFGVRGVPAPPGTPVAGLGYPTSVVPGQNWARLGWWVDGTLVPEVIGNQGLFATTNVDDYTFGSLQPQIALDNVFQPLRRFPGELLIMGENAAPFVGANGSPIPAYAVVAAYTGVLIER